MTVNQILAVRTLNVDRRKVEEVKLASAYPVYVVIPSWLADLSVPPTRIVAITWLASTKNVVILVREHAALMLVVKLLVTTRSALVRVAIKAIHLSVANLGLLLSTNQSLNQSVKLIPTVRLHRLVSNNDVSTHVWKDQRFALPTPSAVSSSIAPFVSVLKDLQAIPKSSVSKLDVGLTPTVHRTKLASIANVRILACLRLAERTPFVGCLSTDRSASVPNVTRAIHTDHVVNLNASSMRIVPATWHVARRIVATPVTAHLELNVPSSITCQSAPVHQVIEAIPTQTKDVSYHRNQPSLKVVVRRTVNVPVNTPVSTVNASTLAQQSNPAESTLNVWLSTPYRYVQ